MATAAVEAPLVYKVGQSVVIVQHLEIDGCHLSEYPGYELGTCHEITDIVQDHIQLDGDVAVLADEIEELQYA